MGISSINLAMGASSYGAYNQKLTQETKQKLITLGIPFNPNITEQEGKALLQKAQSKKNANEQSLSKENSSSKDSLFEQAKKLAQKLGIQVNENIDFQKLLNVIETTLEQKISVSKNDIDALKELKGLSQELANIQAQSNGSSGYDNTNQALMTSLEVLSMYNKNFLYRN